MVHVCDVFDALRTDRPYRGAWPADKVLSYLEEGSGTEFDPDLASAFVQMIRTWEQRVLYVEDPAAPITTGEGVAVPAEEAGPPDQEAPGGSASAAEGAAVSGA